MGKPLKILSWGAGVQSTAIAVLSGIGALPKIDAAIFSDTQFERSATYETVWVYTEWLNKHGIPVYITSGGNIRELGATEHVHIPFWSSNGGPLKDANLEADAARERKAQSSPV